MLSREISLQKKPKIRHRQPPFWNKCSAARPLSVTSYWQLEFGGKLLVSFGAISLKWCSPLSRINFIKQKAWFEIFSRFVQTYRMFSFLHISLAIHYNFRNWHQLFYNRSSSYKIHALPISNFLVYRFHGNIDYLENNIQSNFTYSFLKTGVIFTSIRSREGW